MHSHEEMVGLKILEFVQNCTLIALMDWIVFAL